jgi:cytochrome bd-type quinol oxidase subunit 1
VSVSLILFVTLYAALLAAFFVYAARAVFQGPATYEPLAKPAAVRPGLDSVPAGVPAP